MKRHASTGIILVCALLFILLDAATGRDRPVEAGHIADVLGRSCEAWSEIDSLECIEVCTMPRLPWFSQHSAVLNATDRTMVSQHGHAEEIFLRAVETNIEGSRVFAGLLTHVEVFGL